MIDHHSQTTPTGAGVDDHLDQLTQALDGLRPKAQAEKVDRFSAVYPSVVAALNRKVPHRQLLDTLKKFGISIHPKYLQSMIRTEEERRQQSGDVAYCAHCRQPLSADVDRT